MKNVKYFYRNIFLLALILYTYDKNTRTVNIITKTEEIYAYLLTLPTPSIKNGMV